MTRVSVHEAMAILRSNGMIPSEIGDLLYVDADCKCCGSRYKVGELDIENGSVREEELQWVSPRS